MYERRYGLIRTLAPLHVGASAGEEAGNLNLIFRDAYTQTGMIPGSSIRGRFRAEMRRQGGSDQSETIHWYGSEAGTLDISEARVKFEYASLVWLPVFCPGQPVVWVSCPRLLRRYASIADPGFLDDLPSPYSCSKDLKGRKGDKEVTLFFNLGFMEVKPTPGLEDWIPPELRDEIPPDRLVVVDDAAIGLIHDMALYRQSRVKLADDMKKVDGGAFFNVEALPEASVLIFPVALKPEEAEDWRPFGRHSSQELYFGGLESVGFGRCEVTLVKPAQGVQ
ncbi:MAG: RAMP superfamily CRISPR-associated protein [Chitinophagaceae bacterium]|nr:RAMP superfamily CRISPR-associated protein [Chitinophagaceae bacterium]